MKFRYLGWFCKALLQTVLLLVAVVLGAGIGHGEWWSEPDRERSYREQIAPAPVDWSQVEAEVAERLQMARQVAEAYVDAETEALVVRLENRLDDRFLDWYFNYAEEQGRILQSTWWQVQDWIVPTAPSPEERWRQEVSERFEALVLVPPILQMEIERIAAEATEHWRGYLVAELPSVQAKYQIREADWDRYLGDLAALSVVFDRRTIDVDTKVFVGAGTWATLGTGTVLAQRLGLGSGSVLGRWVAPAVGGGLLLWDYLDHRWTEEEDRPLMRAELTAYLQEVGSALREDPESGLLVGVDALERWALSEWQTVPQCDLESLKLS